MYYREKEKGAGKERKRESEMSNDLISYKINLYLCFTLAYVVEIKLAKL